MEMWLNEKRNTSLNIIFSFWKSDYILYQLEHLKWFWPRWDWMKTFSNSASEDMQGNSNTIKCIDSCFLIQNSEATRWLNWNTVYSRCTNTCWANLSFPITSHTNALETAISFNDWIMLIEREKSFLGKWKQSGISWTPLCVKKASSAGWRSFETRSVPLSLSIPRVRFSEIQVSR